MKIEFREHFRHVVGEIYSPHKRRWTIPVSILLTGIVGAILLNVTAPTVTPAPLGERVWPVAAATVTFATQTPDIKVFGELQAGANTELRSLVAGPVLESGPGFRDGGEVKAGDVLLRIDPFDYQAALDDANAALAEGIARRDGAAARLKAEQDGLVTDQRSYELTKDNYDRAVTLHKKGTVSQKFLDDARLTLTEREAAVNARRNRIDIEAAQLAQNEATLKRLEVAQRRAARDLDDSVLRAPFDGFVFNVRAREGKQLSVNDPVASIASAEGFEVRFTVTDAQYGRLTGDDTPTIGRPVTVLWRMGDRDIPLAGRIVRVGATITAASGGIELFAAVDPGDYARLLRPGAFVEVALPDQQYENVARLPEDALFENSYVFAVSEGRLLRRNVQLLGRSGDDIFVRGDLKDGDAVVTTRFTEIGEGVRVEVR